MHSDCVFLAAASFMGPCSGWEESKTNERQMACVTSSSVLSEPPIVFSSLQDDMVFRVPFLSLAMPYPCIWIGMSA